MRFETLLPCPFCGGEPEEDAGGCIEYHGHEHQDYSITCKQCGAEVYCSVGAFERADVPCSCHHDTRKVCVDKWNKRAAMLQAGTLTNEDTKQAWTGIPDIDNAIIMLDRIETLESCDDDRIEAVKALLRGLAGNSPVIPEGYVMVPKEPTEQMYDAGDRQMATKQVWDAMLAAAPQQHNAPQNIPEIIPGWIPVSERMPEPGILVLVYTPPQPGDYPGDVRIGFDYIDPDGDDPTYWFNHGESYEHFCCVACDGMTGPSEKAPYTHWMPLPASPQEVGDA